MLNILAHRDGSKHRGLCVLLEVTLGLALILVLLFLLGFITLKTYQPDRNLQTLSELVAELPETLKFAVVDQDEESYIIWIGRPRGVTVSGPPVLVFDRSGLLVDRVYDAGDSDNRFVLDLYGKAFRADPITPEAALMVTRREQTTQD